MEAREHPRQPERLRELHALQILDTPREQDFDDVVALASRLCEVPVSVVNLIDAGRQWFKAEVGLGLRETPLETSICAHAILESDFVEIGDTLLDPRMQDNPLCIGQDGLRFYAGALLKTGSGLPIGTLCVLDREPRRLTELQRQALMVLARQVMSQIELRRALRIAAAMRDEADHRVKNSLQALASLVSVQGRGAVGAETKLALAQVGRQIASVATLHAMLNDHGTVQAIDMQPYMAGIGRILAQSIAPNLAVRATGEALRLSPSMAAAIGTIMNEFASNSFKHAFPGGQAGSISFDLVRVGQDAARLTCADDGIGFDWAAVDTGSSLGLRVMTATAETLGGDLVPEPVGRGSALSVTFPLESPVA